MFPWAEARSFCSSYGLEFLTMETLEEAKAVLTMADNNSILRQLPYAWLHVDALSMSLKSKTDWYWTKTGKKISYTIPWRSVAPNDAAGREYCLTIGKGSINEKIGFDDTYPESKTFTGCQDIEISIP
jgi:hypothetical protein